MKITVREMISYLDDLHIENEYRGNEAVTVSGFCSVTNINDASLTWVKKIDEFDFYSIPSSDQIVIITGVPERTVIPPEYNVIICSNPKEAFFGLLNHFWGKSKATGIAPTAVIETDKVGADVSIGHHCYIGPEVEIDDGATIEPNSTIINKVTIGAGTIIHSGAVIGTDGFGYYHDEQNINTKVAHFGGVAIGKNVEIGANTCIDRGTIGDTVIKDNVKIDNLCHIAHNVIINQNSMVIALSMLGGSCKLEDNAYVAPCSAIINQITVGENAFVGMGAVVTKNVEDNKVVAGVPARVLRDRTEKDG